MNRSLNIRLVAFLLVILLLAAQTTAAEDMIVYRDKVRFPRDAEKIDFGKTRITDWNGLTAFLKQFPNLRQVDMFESPIMPKRADALHAAFPQITFGWTLRIVSHDHHQHLVRTDATAFSTQHNNKSTPHTDEQLAVLRYCTQLRALDIGHNAVKNLDFLYDLPELRVLIIALNQITDLTPVASLRHLEYLEMFRNRVRDLGPLSGLTELKDLNICYNRITDVSPLHGLSGLERLWVYHAAFYQTKERDLPKDQLSALKKALPNTHIDSASSSTAGGWRDHPRYEIIYQMFKKGAYIPFSD